MSSRGRLKKRSKAVKAREEAILIGYYKRNLDTFIERELNITLTKWQKFVINKLFGRIKK